MKKIFISLALSACCIIFYASIAFALEMAGIITFETTQKLAAPIRLPSYIYYDVLELKSDGENLVESIIWVCSAFLSNCILYAFPIYLLLMFFSKKVKKPKAVSDPPEPPVFLSENEKIS